MAIETAKTISEFKQFLYNQGLLGVDSDLYEHRELIKTGAGWGGGTSPTLVETRETNTPEIAETNLNSEDIDFAFGYGLYRGRLAAQEFLNTQVIRQATGLPHLPETGVHSQQIIDVYDRLLEDAEQAGVGVDVYLARLTRNPQAASTYTSFMESYLHMGDTQRIQADRAFMGGVKRALNIFKQADELEDKRSSYDYRVPSVTVPSNIDRIEPGHWSVGLRDGTADLLAFLEKKNSEGISRSIDATDSQWDGWLNPFTLDKISNEDQAFVTQHSAILEHLLRNRNTSVDQELEHDALVGIIDDVERYADRHDIAFDRSAPNPVYTEGFVDAIRAMSEDGSWDLLVQEYQPHFDNKGQFMGGLNPQVFADIEKFANAPAEVASSELVAVANIKTLFLTDPELFGGNRSIYNPEQNMALDNSANSVVFTNSLTEAIDKATENILQAARTNTMFKAHLEEEMGESIDVLAERTDSDVINQRIIDLFHSTATYSGFDTLNLGPRPIPDGAMRSFIAQVDSMRDEELLAVPGMAANNFAYAMLEVASRDLKNNTDLSLSGDEINENLAGFYLQVIEEHQSQILSAQPDLLRTLRGAKNLSLDSDYRANLMEQMRKYPPFADIHDGNFAEKIEQLEEIVKSYQITGQFMGTPNDPTMMIDAFIQAHKDTGSVSSARNHYLNRAVKYDDIVALHGAYDALNDQQKLELNENIIRFQMTREAEDAGPLAEFMGAQRNLLDRPTRHLDLGEIAAFNNENTDLLHPEFLRSLHKTIAGFQIRMEIEPGELGYMDEKTLTALAGYPEQSPEHEFYVLYNNFSAVHGIVDAHMRDAVEKGLTKPQELFAPLDDYFVQALGIGAPSNVRSSAEPTPRRTPSRVEEDKAESTTGTDTDDDLTFTVDDDHDPLAETTDETPEIVVGEDVEEEVVLGFRQLLEQLSNHADFGDDVTFVAANASADNLADEMTVNAFSGIHQNILEWIDEDSDVVEYASLGESAEKYEAFKAFREDFLRYTKEFGESVAEAAADDSENTITAESLQEEFDGKRLSIGMQKISNLMDAGLITVEDLYERQILSLREIYATGLLDQGAISTLIGRDVASMEDIPATLIDQNIESNPSQRVDDLENALEIFLLDQADPEKYEQVVGLYYITERLALDQEFDMGSYVELPNDLKEQRAQLNQERLDLQNELIALGDVNVPPALAQRLTALVERDMALGSEINQYVADNMPEELQDVFLPKMMEYNALQTRDTLPTLVNTVLNNAEDLSAEDMNMLMIQISSAFIHAGKTGDIDEELENAKSMVTLYSALSEIDADISAFYPDAKRKEAPARRGPAAERGTPAATGTGSTPATELEKDVSNRMKQLQRAFGWEQTGKLPTEEQNEVLGDYVLEMLNDKFQHLHGRVINTPEGRVYVDDKGDIYEANAEGEPTGEKLDSIMRVGTTDKPPHGATFVILNSVLTADNTAEELYDAKIHFLIDRQLDALERLTGGDRAEAETLFGELQNADGRDAKKALIKGRYGDNPDHMEVFALFMAEQRRLDGFLNDPNAIEINRYFEDYDDYHRLAGLRDLVNYYITGNMENTLAEERVLGGPGSSAQDILVNDRYFDSRVYDLLDRGQDVPGWLIGDDYAGRDLSRQEVAEIAFERFQDNMDLMGVVPGDVTRAIFEGRMNPYFDDFKLAYEGLGKPEGARMSLNQVNEALAADPDNAQLKVMQGIIEAEVNEDIAYLRRQPLSKDVIDEIFAPYTRSDGRYVDFNYLSLNELEERMKTLTGEDLEQAKKSHGIISDYLNGQFEALRDKPLREGELSGVYTNFRDGQANAFMGTLASLGDGVETMVGGEVRTISADDAALHMIARFGGSNFIRTYGLDKLPEDQRGNLVEFTGRGLVVNRDMTFDEFKAHLDKADIPQSLKDGFMQDIEHYKNNYSVFSYFNLRSMNNEDAFNFNRDYLDLRRERYYPEILDKQYNRDNFILDRDEHRDLNPEGDEDNQFDEHDDSFDENRLAVTTPPAHLITTDDRQSPTLDPNAGMKIS